MPGSSPGCGRGQHLTFLEYDFVAYQIKGDRAYSNVVANILPEVFGLSHYLTSVWG